MGVGVAWGGGGFKLDVRYKLDDISNHQEFMRHKMRLKRKEGLDPLLGGWAADGGRHRCMRERIKENKPKQWKHPTALTPAPNKATKQQKKSRNPQQVGPDR